MGTSNQETKQTLVWEPVVSWNNINLYEARGVFVSAKCADGTMRLAVTTGKGGLTWMKAKKGFTFAESGTTDNVGLPDIAPPQYYGRSYLEKKDRLAHNAVLEPDGPTGRRMETFRCRRHFFLGLQM